MENILVNMAEDGSLNCENPDFGRVEELCAKTLKIKLNDFFKSNIISYFTISFQPFGCGNKIVTDNIYKDFADDDLYYENGYLYCPLYDFITAAPYVRMQIDGCETDKNGDLYAIYKSGIIELKFKDSITGNVIIPDRSMAEQKISEKVADAVKIEMEKLIVDGEKLADFSVENKKLADYSVTSDKLADGSVLNSKLATDSVTTGKIADKSVTHFKLFDNAVWTNNIDDCAVVNSKLGDNSVSNEKLENKSVTTEKLADKSVTHDKMTINSVWTDNIRDYAIVTNKLDVGAVTEEKIADESVTTNKLDSKAVTGAKIAQKTIKNSNLGFNCVTKDNILDGEITPEKLSEEYVTVENFNRIIEAIYAGAGTSEISNKLELILSRVVGGSENDI